MRHLGAGRKCASSTSLNCTPAPIRRLRALLNTTKEKSGLDHALSLTQDWMNGILRI